MKRKTNAPDVTYLVKRTQGNGKTVTYQHVVVPAAWRITYGGVFGKRSQQMYQGGAPLVSPNSMRIWEGTLQRACIDNVESFIDTRIKLTSDVVTNVSVDLGGAPSL